MLLSFSSIRSKYTLNFNVLLGTGSALSSFYNSSFLFQSLDAMVYGFSGILCGKGSIRSARMYAIGRVLVE